MLLGCCEMHVRDFKDAFDFLVGIRSFRLMSINLSSSSLDATSGSLYR